MLKGESVFMFQSQKRWTWRRGLTGSEPPRQNRPVRSCRSSSSGARVEKAGQVQTAPAVGLPPAPARPAVLSPSDRQRGECHPLQLNYFVLSDWMRSAELPGWQERGAAECTVLGWSWMNGECFLCSSVLLGAKKGLNLNKSCICKVSGWHG